MTQHLLTKVILDIVSEKARDDSYGVSLINLPSFDYASLAKDLQSERHIEIYFLGFDAVDEAELKSVLKDTDAASHFYTVEEAEVSRNSGNDSVFRVLVIKRQEIEKLSSLRWFEPIDLDLVYKRSCGYAKNKLEKSNTFINNLLSAINRRDISAILNFERVLEYLDILLQSPSDQLSHIVKDKIYKLGLCADSSLDVGKQTVETIKARIKQNKICVAKIGSLDQAERKSINNYYASNPNSGITRSILQFYKTKDIELLSKMELDEVERALKSAADKDSKKTSSKAKGSTVNPTALAAQLIFEDRMDAIGDLLDSLEQELGRRFDPDDDKRPDTDKPIKVEIPVNGTKLAFVSTPTTEKVADELVDDLAFGGVVYANVLNPREAIDSLDKYEFKAFDENYLEHTLTCLDTAHSFTQNETISLRMEQFIKARKQVVGFAMRLQDAPMLQVIKERPAFSAYLDAYAKLLSSINEDFPKIWRDSPAIAKNIINTIISLDMLYIIGENECHAMPTSLNPLYLWKYIRLAEEILDSRGIDDSDICHLSNDDKDFIIRKADDIPDPQTVVLLPGSLREQGSKFLPLAGRIGCMPVYSSRQQISKTESGMDTLRQAITRYLCLYPHARMMLRLCFVNPPSVELLISMLKRLNSDKEFSVKGMDLTIYRTKEAPADWVEIEDSSLNDGLLGRVKTKGDLQFRLTVENKVLSYQKILQRVDKEQHLIVVFDPNEKRIDVAQNNRQIHIHPLCVPQVYSFDRYTQEVEIRASNEGGIFSDYSAIIQKLNEQSSSFKSTGVFFNTPLREETYKALLEKTDWLIMLDQNLRSWDISLRSTSEKLFYSANNYRSTGIYSKNNKKFVLGYSKLIEDMGNFIPQLEGVKSVIDAIREINDDGLLSIVSHSSNLIFDKNHGKGSLGLAIAAISYRRHFPDAILIGLDSQLAREWLSERDDGLLPDLVGIRLSEDAVYIDLIEVKTHEDYQINGNIISGHAVEQVTVLERLITEMLGYSEKVTTVARREILREQVYEGLFNTNWDSSRKFVATQMLNDLFAGELNININKIISSVIFDQAQSTIQSYVGDEAFAGQQYTLRIIGADEIQDILAGVERTVEYYPNWGTESIIALNKPDITNGDNDKCATASLQNEAFNKDISSSVPKLPQILEQRGGQSPSLHQDSFEHEQRVEIDKFVEEQCIKLNKVLRDFGIKALPLNASLVQQAARFTRFKVQLCSGETIRNLAKFKTDISREMESNGEILIDNIGGTRFVGIDIPFEQTGRPLMLLEHISILDENDGLLNILAGQMPDGQVRLIDISKAPHLLVAGATNSGKTIFLYSLLISLLYQFSAEELELLIIDPKQTDFAFFNRLPHLRGGRVITSPEEALASLDDINSNEKEQRTQTLLHPNVHRDIESYNRSHPNNKMKRLVIVIDEYADLVQAAEMQGIRRDFEARLCMLAARVRNLGIHLVIATQRPSATIVTGSLKANLPFRISFRLPAHQDSMTILDRPGAENLLGRGDMLMVTESEVLRMQGFYIDEQNLMQFLEKISQNV